MPGERRRSPRPAEGGASSAVPLPLGREARLALLEQEQRGLEHRLARLEAQHLRHPPLQPPPRQLRALEERLSKLESSSRSSQGTEPGSVSASQRVSAATASAGDPPRTVPLPIVRSEPSALVDERRSSPWEDRKQPLRRTNDSLDSGPQQESSLSDQGSLPSSILRFSTASVSTAQSEKEVARSDGNVSCPFSALTTGQHSFTTSDTKVAKQVKQSSIVSGPFGMRMQVTYPLFVSTDNIPEGKETSQNETSEDENEKRGSEQINTRFSSSLHLLKAIDNESISSKMIPQSALLEQTAQNTDDTHQRVTNTVSTSTDPVHILDNHPPLSSDIAAHTSGCSTAESRLIALEKRMQNLEKSLRLQEYSSRLARLDEVSNQLEEILDNFDSRDQRQRRSKSRDHKRSCSTHFDPKLCADSICHAQHTSCKEHCSLTRHRPTSASGSRNSHDVRACKEESYKRKSPHRIVASNRDQLSSHISKDCDSRSKDHGSIRKHSSSTCRQSHKTCMEERCTKHSDGRSLRSKLQHAIQGAGFQRESGGKKFDDERQRKGMLEVTEAEAVSTTPTIHSSKEIIEENPRQSEWSSQILLEGLEEALVLGLTPNDLSEEFLQLKEHVRELIEKRNPIQKTLIDQFKSVLERDIHEKKKYPKSSINENTDEKRKRIRRNLGLDVSSPDSEEADILDDQDWNMELLAWENFMDISNQLKSYRLEGSMLALNSLASLDEWERKSKEFDQIRQSGSDFPIKTMHISEKIVEGSNPMEWEPVNLLRELEEALVLDLLPDDLSGEYLRLEERLRQLLENGNPIEKDLVDKLESVLERDIHEQEKDTKSSTNEHTDEKRKKIRRYLGVDVPSAGLSHSVETEVSNDQKLNMELSAWENLMDIFNQLKSYHLKGNTLLRPSIESIRPSMESKKWERQNKEHGQGRQRGADSSISAMHSSKEIVERTSQMEFDPKNLLRVLVDALLLNLSPNDLSEDYLNSEEMIAELVKNRKRFEKDLVDELQSILERDIRVKESDAMRTSNEVQTDKKREVIRRSLGLEKPSENLSDSRNVEDYYDQNYNFELKAWENLIGISNELKSYHLTGNMLSPSSSISGGMDDISENDSRYIPKTPPPTPVSQSHPSKTNIPPKIPPILATSILERLKNKTTTTLDNLFNPTNLPMTSKSSEPAVIVKRIRKSIDLVDSPESSINILKMTEVKRDFFWRNETVAEPSTMWTFRDEDLEIPRDSNASRVEKVGSEPVEELIQTIEGDHSAVSEDAKSSDEVVPIPPQIVFPTARRSSLRGDGERRSIRHVSISGIDASANNSETFPRPEGMNKRGTNLKIEEETKVRKLRQLSQGEFHPYPSPENDKPSEIGKGISEASHSRTKGVVVNEESVEINKVIRRTIIPQAQYQDNIERKSAHSLIPLRQTISGSTMGREYVDEHFQGQGSFVDSIGRTDPDKYKSGYIERQMLSTIKSRNNEQDLQIEEYRKVYETTEATEEAKDIMEKADEWEKTYGSIDPSIPSGRISEYVDEYRRISTTRISNIDKTKDKIVGESFEPTSGEGGRISPIDNQSYSSVGEDNVTVTTRPNENMVPAGSHIQICGGPPIFFNAPSPQLLHAERNGEALCGSPPPPVNRTIQSCVPGDDRHRGKSTCSLPVSTFQCTSNDCEHPQTRSFFQDRSHTKRNRGLSPSQVHQPSRCICNGFVTPPVATIRGQSCVSVSSGPSIPFNQGTQFSPLPNDFSHQDGMVYDTNVPNHIIDAAPQESTSFPNVYSNAQRSFWEVAEFQADYGCGVTGVPSIPTAKAKSKRPRTLPGVPLDNALDVTGTGTKVGCFTTSGSPVYGRNARSRVPSRSKSVNVQRSRMNSSSNNRKSISASSRGTISVRAPPSLPPTVGTSSNLVAWRPIQRHPTADRRASRGS